MYNALNVHAPGIITVTTDSVELLPPEFTTL
jgi:hypothetical protein